MESLVLKEIAKRVSWYKRMYSEFYRTTEIRVLATGTPAPAFSGSIVGKDEILKTTDLEGAPSMLMFVSPQEFNLPLYENVGVVLHSLWHRVQGRLYLICKGTEESCVQMVRDLGAENHAPAIVDMDGRISRSFRVTTTPQVVELDSEIRVKRYGAPEVLERRLSDG
jgi:hypothetical protein